MKWCPLVASMTQNYDFDDMTNLGFSSPPQNLISIFLILLPVIRCYKTNKLAKLYCDQMEIWGIMAVQILLKMSIFPLSTQFKLAIFHVPQYTFPFVMKIFGTF